MLEENVEIKCLKKDVALIKDIVRSSESEFNQMCSVNTNITINERQNLAESDIGGVYITSNNGRIVCNNTLAARLDYSMQQLLPDIRHVLFKTTNAWSSHSKDPMKKVDIKAGRYPMINLYRNLLCMSIVYLSILSTFASYPQIERETIIKRG